MQLAPRYNPSRELFFNLTLRELRSKYKRSFLGWAWSLVTPLATMAVYTVVFRFFLRASPPAGANHLDVYALFLMCGLLPWTFFSSSLMGCIGSLVGNSSLITKTYFDRKLLPAATVGAMLVTHVIEMTLLTVVLVGFGNWQAAAFLPVVFVLMALMTLVALGTGLLMSALNVYFRDIEHFMAILLMIWMYLTPIIYPITSIPARYQVLVKLNPMTEMTECFRNVLYYAKLPTLTEFGYFAAFAFVMLGIGWTVFSKLQEGFGEEL